MAYIPAYKTHLGLALKVEEGQFPFLQKNTFTSTVI